MFYLDMDLKNLFWGTGVPGWETGSQTFLIEQGSSKGRHWGNGEGTDEPVECAMLKVWCIGALVIWKRSWRG